MNNRMYVLSGPMLNMGMIFTTLKVIEVSASYEKQKLRVGITFFSTTIQLNSNSTHHKTGWKRRTGSHMGKIG
jgi:hypothetical protein